MVCPDLIQLLEGHEGNLSKHSFARSKVDEHHVSEEQAYQAMQMTPMMQMERKMAPMAMPNMR